MTVRELFFAITVDFVPRAINTLLLAGQVTAKPTVVAIPIEHLLVFLASYAVVIAYPIVGSTILTVYPPNYTTLDKSFACFTRQGRTAQRREPDPPALKFLRRHPGLGRTLKLKS